MTYRWLQQNHNLFPNKNALFQMTYANVTTQLTQMMIKYRDVLWTVPQRLVSQIRRIYQAEALKQSNYTPVSIGRVCEEGKRAVVCLCFFFGGVFVGLFCFNCRGIDGFFERVVLFHFWMGLNVWVFSNRKIFSQTFEEEVLRHEIQKKRP